MTETVSSCPLCGSPTARLFDRREFRGHMVTNQICQKCGLIYESPRMTEAERDAFYEAEYRLLYQGQAEPSSKDLVVQLARAELTLKFVQPWVKNINQVLDIGCSAGTLLQSFQTHFHAQSTGIEPGLLYRQYAQDLNITVYPSLDELPRSLANTFDMISLMHVLEHLPDPVVYLRQLRQKWLHPQGWLLVEVPNLYGHDCFEVAHLVSFSPHTLKQVVLKAGFKISRLHLHGMPRSKLIPLYITLLAQPIGDQPFAIEPEYLVDIKRKFSFFQRRLVTRILPRQAWLTIEAGGQESIKTYA